MRNKILFGVLLTLGLAFVLFGIFTLFSPFVKPHFASSVFVENRLKDHANDNIANIIGSSFSLAGVLFLIATFVQQNSTFQRERFENRFFEMMKIYRENVADMDYVSPNETEKNQVTTGRKVFVKIHREFINLYKRLLKIYLTTTEKTEDKLGKKEKFDIAALSYSTVFTGLGAESDRMLEQYFEGGYSRTYPFLTEYIINDLKKLTARYDSKIKYYGGHQIRLAHHFRHLYQTVTFVHNQSFLNKREKYDYVKVLRGQMSTFEQAVLFYNSMFSAGDVWEFAKRDFDYNRKYLHFEIFGWDIPVKLIKYKKRDLLITRYRLIKNLPPGICNSLNPKDYFKKLRFEYEE